jgi:tRNA (guanine-N7-)-methyltransferase
MSRIKLKKFTEITYRTNIIEPSKANFKSVKDNWNTHFGNSNPIVLELACGNGEYTNGLAIINPNKNYIGVDIKGDRIWQASTDSQKNYLTNTAFLRVQIDHLQDFFGPNEVSEIWIIHPDPFVAGSDERRRLTSYKFLEVYRKFIKRDCPIHLKTDNKNLFDYTLEVLANQNIKPEIACTDLYNSHYVEDHCNIVTRFEKKALDKQSKIYYIKWCMS